MSSVSPSVQLAPSALSHPTLKMQSSDATCYLVIGAGIFGISSALHLKKSQPNSRVRLVDRTAAPCPAAASHDLNKIIRADYADLFYMKLALESMKEWRSNPIYSPFYHESGILIADNIGWGRTCVENYKHLHVDVDTEMLSTEAATKRFPMFADTSWDGATQCYWNPSSGWSEAGEALSSCLQAACQIGVEVTEATIVRLLLDDVGICVGAQASDGSEYRATHVLLCTGAYTPKLLLDTFPHAGDIQLGDRLYAAGAVSCTASYDASEAAKIEGVPVLINTMPNTHGESVPPLSNGLLKFNHEPSFTNNTLHSPSEKTVSIPPSRETQSTWSHDVPQKLKDEIQTVVRHTYGTTLQGLKIEQYRMCWDAVTPTQDWLITPHPKVPRLFIAAGGSFHSWKFLPTIGMYVARMVCEGFTEGSEEARRWAWDKSKEGSACPMYWPKRDLGDLQE